MQNIQIEVIINSPIEHVWKCWTTAEDVMNWNHASDDWYCPKAVNNLTVGGNFSYIMSARDGSNSFDFSGIYQDIVMYKLISYEITGGRKVEVKFSKINETQTKVVEIFEIETQNSVEKQREGWQAILNNFKQYSEL